MDQSQARLRITTPEGQFREEYPLTKVRTIIGRFPPPMNDISLLPDPEQYVTRERHCLVEHEGANYYLLSPGLNATLLKRKEERFQVRERIRLLDQDEFYIQGGLSEHGEPLFWNFTFCDPGETRPTHAAPFLEYEESTCRLFYVTGQKRARIHLRAKEDKLIRYMFSCNRRNNDTSVLISVPELIRAVWEDEQATDRTNQELHRLISSLRSKLEPHTEVSSFLINERGMGYLLVTHPVPVLTSHRVQINQ